MYKSLQALEYKKQKILKAQEASKAEEPQVDAGMTLDLGRVPWIRAEREHLALLREELGDDWSAIASRLGTGRTALHCEQHVVDGGAAGGGGGGREKLNWGLVGDRIGTNGGARAEGDGGGRSSSTPIAGDSVVFSLLALRARRRRAATRRRRGRGEGCSRFVVGQAHACNLQIRPAIHEVGRGCWKSHKTWLAPSFAD